MTFHTKTLAELSELLAAGHATSRQITEDFISVIEAKDKDINAFVNTTFDVAREMADASDSRRALGAQLSDIDGIPITLKDVVCTVEAKTTASSNILKDFQSPYDAHVWKKLKDAGAVLLGKVNTDEFTMGASTETSAFGTTKNPHDTSHVPGGSSGGSAAAVAADMCAMSIGTDTGGSIRQPAHFCGVTGLKVSYGRVSRWGTIPMASSLDTVGPIAKTPQDCAMILDIIAGKDPNDATTPDIPTPKSYTSTLDKSLSGMRIGIPKEYFIDGIDPEVLQVIEATKAILEEQGATLVDVSLPHTKYGAAVYYILAPSEISANMTRYDGIRFGDGHKKDSLEEIYTSTRTAGLGDEVKRRILIGNYALSSGYYDAYYLKAQKVRTLIIQDFDTVFEDVDALLTPVSPTPAFQIGGHGNDPVKMYLEDVFTIPSSLAGITGISVPVGQSTDNLPIGAQILCPAYKEDRVLNIAHQIYTATESK